MGFTKLWTLEYFSRVSFCTKTLFQKLLGLKWAISCKKILIRNIFEGHFRSICTQATRLLSGTVYTVHGPHSQTVYNQIKFSFNFWWTFPQNVQHSYFDQRSTLCVFGIWHKGIHIRYYILNALLFIQSCKIVTDLILQIIFLAIQYIYNNIIIYSYIK